MSAWPSRSCTTRKSAPFCNRWLAKAWRSTCGLTRAACDPRRRRDRLQVAREGLARQMAAFAVGGKQPGAGRKAGRDFVQQRAIAFGSPRAPARTAAPADPCRPCRARGSAAPSSARPSAAARSARRRASPRRREARSGRPCARRPAARAAAASGSSSPSRATSMSFSTSATPSTFGSGRRRRGPSSASVGSSPRKALDEQMFVELLDRRQPPRDRRRAEACARRPRPAARGCRRRSPRAAFCRAPPRKST